VNDETKCLYTKTAKSSLQYSEMTRVKVTVLVLNSEHEGSNAPSFSSPVVYQVNPGQLVPLGFFIHLFQNRPFTDKWLRFFMGLMPFLSPNQQHQSTEGNSTSGLAYFLSSATIRLLKEVFVPLLQLSDASTLI